eukprot:CAMPEP_0117620016 /NCGR_PEP_ID=MMETSP0784-20121206/86914_1 /TAXON_ID=39447 /ORGANISM="" /LENGTH=161 /DNA_ID=CAMNT_0005423923 /DNA_START=506 /DNA_END=991 /DNA_ORIENTATION=+
MEVQPVVRVAYTQLGLHLYADAASAIFACQLSELPRDVVDEVVGCRRTFDGGEEAAKRRCVRCEIGLMDRPKTLRDPFALLWPCAVLPSSQIVPHLIQRPTCEEERQHPARALMVFDSNPRAAETLVGDTAGVREALPAGVGNCTENVDEKQCETARGNGA